MKPSHSITLLTACLALTLASGQPAKAQDNRAPASPAATAQSSGAISGRVQNAAIGRYPTNARVAV